MSEDAKKDEKKDDKKDAKAAPDKGGDKAKKAPPIGAILAVVVILAAGMGMGFFLSSLVKPKAKTPEETAAAGGHGEQAGQAGGDAHGGEEGKGAAKGGHSAPGALLHAAGEFDLEDLMSNVRGQQGRRFIKMNCVLWIESTTLKKMTSGGGGHGGGTPGEDVKRILKAAFEEHLKTYDLEDLTGINIYKLLEKSFKEIADRELRSLYEKLPSEPLVNRVVLTNMLVQ